MTRFPLLAALGLLAALTPALPARADTTPTVAVVEVDAPPAAAWSAFTDPKEMVRWMVALAEMDLRVGGLMRTHYDPKGSLGDMAGIENRILAFDPGRMLSLQVHRTPATFPFKNAVQGMWTVIYFDPLEGGRTRVTVRGLGWREDEESQRMRAFFDQGNRYTLDRLKQYLAKKPAQ